MSESYQAFGSFINYPQGKRGKDQTKDSTKDLTNQVQKFGNKICQAVSQVLVIVSKVPLC